jgi:eukaryotic-like serine/threonine-protein kinase
MHREKTMKVVKVLDQFAGGFGRVEKVQLDDGSFAARKVFAPSMHVTDAVEAKLRERFAREVKHQGLLKNPALMPIIDSDLKANPPWFMMPFAEKNYEKEIAAEKASGAKVTPEPLADILSALEVLHSLGYTHRDLKPANVLFHDGRWTLSDFGLILPPTGTTTQLTTQSAWGTVAYAAPEQAQNFGAVTPAADIYSFGCILHDIFGTGARIPYGQHSAPGQIGWIIEKCTERVPSKRFKNVGKLRSAVISILTSPTTAAIPTAKATEWINELANAKNWTLETLERFARYADAEMPNAGQADPLALALDEDLLTTLVGRDPGLGESIAKSYCAWVAGTAFAWAFCDVLVKRLEAIFAAGTIGAQSTAVLTAARLGESHNRWYVMERLHEMCGATCDATVAQRIAFDIQADDAEWNFVRCARTINRSVLNYHPLIAAVVDET